MHHSRLSPHNDQGWTLVETMVALGVAATIAAAAVLIVPGVVAFARADGGAGQLEAALRVAREQAISQRRNVRLDFVAPRTLVVSREEVPGPAVTEISRMDLEGGAQFLTYAGVPDTPDGFGNASATAFGGAANVKFTSEGTFVDQNGDEVNGTMFLGIPNQPMTARAVTVFGPTALVRGWRWQGNGWVR